jgi:hypothetical protein
VVASTGVASVADVTDVTRVMRADAPRAARRTRPDTESGYRYFCVDCLERQPKPRLIV